MDKRSADNIITEYLQKIYGFAIKKCFSYEEAEDLCAEIVKEVYLSLLRSNEIVNIEGYIWRISEHTYAKHVATKKKHEGVSFDGVELPSYEEDFLGTSGEDILLLRREIAFLTKKRREIVYAFYYENKTISYIAKTTGMPEGTVKWHLNKARNELKEGFSMERKIGKLGLSPIKAQSFGHSGCPGTNGGPEYYLEDKLNLNIVYSVYFTPKTKEEIAEELGVTPVYIEDRVEYLEGNGFLVRTEGNRFTTYVKFSSRTYSLEQIENTQRMRLAIAELLAKEYVPLVRAAIADVEDVYIPSGNRELLEAAVVFYSFTNLCSSATKSWDDLAKYRIKTTDGGDYIAFVHLPKTQSDPEYTPTLHLPSYWACGNMYRDSKKYPAVSSWAIDSRYSSREGAWSDNLYTDYEYIYEYLTGAIADTPANAEKFKRLRKRNYVTKDGKVNIMLVKDDQKKFVAKLPKLSEDIRKKFADFALEAAMLEAKNYPPQMQDLIIAWTADGFIGAEVALMVMDILYANGSFKPLTENEKVTSNLIMFTDVLPE